MLSDAPVYAVIAASDLARARSWYADTLGVEPTIDMGGAYMYRVGGTWFMLYQSEFAGTAKNTVAGWVVEDLDTAMAELRRRGVVFEDYDIEGGPKTIDGVAQDDLGGRTAWFTDCEGNILTISQLPPGFPPA